MDPVTFLIALAALSIGTFAMRFAGVKMGAALAVRGRRRTPVRTGAPANDAAAYDAATASVNDAPPPDPSTASARRAPDVNDAPAPDAATASAVEDDEPTSRVTAWMDRATVVLIGAVFATTAIFDGRAIADPARLIGVGVGVLAAVLRVPMLVCVVLGMAVCAGIRMTGIL